MTGPQQSRHCRRDISIKFEKLRIVDRLNRYGVMSSLLGETESGIFGLTLDVGFDWRDPSFVLDETDDGPV